MRRLVCRREEVFRGPLLLVNRDHPLQGVGLPELEAVGPDVLLERQAARRLRACIQAVGGEEEIVPVSGWRSQTEQQAIWDDTLADRGEAFTRTYVALPGCSEHQTGLAIDLGKRAENIDFIRPDFPDNGVCRAFRALAPEYGFVERYTGEKESLTGIGREPWHFRYVGEPHARLMTKHNLCMEEYGDFLRQGPRSLTLADGRAAQVRYVPCAGEETEIPLPDGPCQVAGDNVDGFLLTVWGWGE